MKKPRAIKAIGRKRRTLGWTLLTLGLLVAGVWVASGWWRFPLRSADPALAIDRGSIWVASDTLHVEVASPVIVSRPAAQPALGWRAVDGERAGLMKMQDFGLLALAQHSRPGPPAATAWFVVAALWPLALATATAGAWLLRSSALVQRRALKGLCAKCGYSLAGLGAGVPCPECGPKK